MTILLFVLFRLWFTSVRKFTDYIFDLWIINSLAIRSSSMVPVQSSLGWLLLRTGQCLSRSAICSLAVHARLGLELLLVRSGHDWKFSWCLLDCDLLWFGIYAQPVSVPLLICVHLMAFCGLFGLNMMISLVCYRSV